MHSLTIVTARVKPLVIQNFLTFDSIHRTPRYDHSMQSCWGVLEIMVMLFIFNFPQFVILETWWIHLFKSLTIFSSVTLTLSNSSIKHTPLSANTRAPASRVHSRVTGCLCTYAVNPTAEAPWPVVNTARCAVFSTYFRNCDFAVPGSPQSKMLISPRSLCFPPVKLDGKE